MPEPKLIVLDEPGHGLDTLSCRELLQDLRRLRDDAGTTVVFTTAAAQDAASADRVGILQEGRLAAIGRSADLADALGRFTS